MFINKVVGKELKPLTVSSNNQGSLALAKDNKFHSRTKHIDLHYHFIHEAVEDRKFEVTYIPTEDNIANIFTKSLAKPKFSRFVGMLGGVQQGEIRSIRSRPDNRIVSPRDKRLHTKTNTRCRSRGSVEGGTSLTRLSISYCQSLVNTYLISD